MIGAGFHPPSGGTPWLLNRVSVQLEEIGNILIFIKLRLCAINF